MSKSKPPKKKVVVTTSQQKKAVPSSKKPRRASVKQAKEVKQELVLGRKNYLLIGVGAVLVGLGIILMSGGAMPSPEVWDDNIIYSFRRTVLAPIVILAGLVVEIVAIFKK